MAVWPWTPQLQALLNPPSFSHGQYESCTYCEATTTHLWRTTTGFVWQKMSGRLKWEKVAVDVFTPGSDSGEIFVDWKSWSHLKIFTEIALPTDTCQHSKRVSRLPFHHSSGARFVEDTWDKVTISKLGLGGSWWRQVVKLLIFCEVEAPKMHDLKIWIIPSSTLDTCQVLVNESQSKFCIWHSTPDTWVEQ